MADIAHIDRLGAAKEAAAILLKARGQSLPAPVAQSYYLAGQAWATLAVALGEDTIEIDKATLTPPEWSPRG